MNARLTLASLAAGLLATSSIAVAGSVDVSTRQIISSSQIGRGTFVTHAPGDFTRLFIVAKAGIIRIYNLKTGTLLSTPFLSITGVVRDNSNEQGLLGLAFHPDYQENGYFYVNFTNNSNDTEIRRYSVTADPNVATTAGSLEILTIDQPFTNHNGGWMGFGPDEYLYISTGDGGSACDPGQRSQDVTDQLLGKMLRIDIDATGFGVNYDIPPDNPFAGGPGDDEIWAYGLRNAWRCSFDRATGDLYIADVGQGVREEINVQPFDSAGGENYGWDCEEGFLCASSSGCGAGACDCGSPSLTPPVDDYSHSGGNCSVTGGYVYRGCAIPSEVGNYFFSDYCSGQIWSWKWDGAGGTTDFANRTSDLDPPGGSSISFITSFGEDAWGEMYIMEDGGELWQIVDLNNLPRYTDVVCDGEVNTEDLLVVLGAWGPCVGCPADVNGDDQVNTEDLLALLADWG